MRISRTMPSTWAVIGYTSCHNWSSHVSRTLRAPMGTPPKAASGFSSSLAVISISAEIYLSEGGRKPLWNIHCLFLCSAIHACTLLPLPARFFQNWGLGEKAPNSPKTLWIDESDVWSIYIEHLIFSFLHSNNTLTYEVNIMFRLNYGMCANHDAGLLVLAKI